MIDNPGEIKMIRIDIDDITKLTLSQARTVADCLLTLAQGNDETGTAKVEVGAIEPLCDCDECYEPVVDEEYVSRAYAAAGIPADRPVSPINGAPIERRESEKIRATMNVPTVLTTAQVQLDSTGIPWDERIHARTKVINPDGTWRKRRGVSEADMATVEAQLHELMATASPRIEGAHEAVLMPMITYVPAPPPPPPAGHQDIAAAPFIGSGTVIAVSDNVNTPPQFVPPAPAAQVVTSNGTTVTGLDAFPAWIARVTAHMDSPTARLTSDGLMGILREMGVANLYELFNKPELIPGVMGRVNREMNPV